LCYRRVGLPGIGSQRVEKINEDDFLVPRKITVPDNGNRDISLENAAIVIFEEVRIIRIIILSWDPKTQFSWPSSNGGIDKC